MRKRCPDRGTANSALPDEHWIDRIPHPVDLERADILNRLAQAGDLAENGLPQRDFVDIRFVDPDLVSSLTQGRFDRMAWVRSDQRLPDPSLYHVCAMTYFSDLTLVGTVMGHHGGFDATSELEIASLDHAMWFHAESAPTTGCCS